MFNFGGINAESFQLRSTTLKHTHKRYRRPKVRSIADSDHVTLREQLFRVAAEPGFPYFSRSKFKIANTPAPLELHAVAKLAHVYFLVQSSRVLFQFPSAKFPVAKIAS